MATILPLFLFFQDFLKSSGFPSSCTQKQRDGSPATDHHRPVCYDLWPIMGQNTHTGTDTMLSFVVLSFYPFTFRAATFKATLMHQTEITLA